MNTNQKLSPSPAPDLTDVSTHFAFGQNWASYANIIGDEQITKAISSLSRLITPAEMQGKTFLDIGCGSGLSMLAALKLGAAHVTGIDIDPNSVATARKVLSAQGTDNLWSIFEKSVFALDPAIDNTFDIVHSWGVLHHTGDMSRAIDRAINLVTPGGLFVLALYRKAPMCNLWTHEKRIYTKASSPTQALMRFIYKASYIAGLIATGRNPFKYIKNYTTHRGMDWHHDVHDWMGGYPYESVTPDQVSKFLDKAGFTLVRSFTKTARAGGLFGTHCDEFVARRTGV